MLNQDPLAQLRDIHLPAAVSAWPPAPGWWLLALIVLAVVVFAVIALRGFVRRNRYRRLAQKQLTAITSRLTHKQSGSATDQTVEYLQQLNQLLKQTALAANSDQPIAGLHGSQWLQFLDRWGDTTDFSQGAGKVLLEGPYSVCADPVDLPALNQIARRWIKQHKITITGGS